MKNASILSLFLLGFFFVANARHVEPIAENHPNPIKSGYIRDTMTLNTENGNLKISRECSDKHSTILTSTQLKLNTEVFHEAERKGIKADMVVVEFKRDENCEVTHYSVRQYGQLETLNDVAKKFCAEIIHVLELQDAYTIGCPSKACENLLVPITLHFI